MESSRPQLLILADAPDALRMFFGISLLERLLRVVQRLGFREAIILSNSPDEVAAHLAKPSWARAEVALSFRPRKAGALRVSEVATGADRILVVSAGFYYDARLLKAMAEQSATTLLVDSAPPPECVELWKDRGGVFGAAALVDGAWLSRQDHTAALMDQLSSDAATGRIEACDAARQPAYVTSLRKHVRPVFFPAPPPELLPVAERFPRAAAQPGVQAFVERLNAPIEDWIVATLVPDWRHSKSSHVRDDADRSCGDGVLRHGPSLVRGGAGLRWSKCSMAWMESWPARKWKRPQAANGSTSSIIASSCRGGLRSRFIFRLRGLRHAYWLLVLLVGSDLIDRLAKTSSEKESGAQSG